MVSREEAVKIAAEHDGPGFKFYSISHSVAEVSPNMAYRANAHKWLPDDVWCVLCSAQPAHTGLSSSRAIVIAKETGEILYDGSADDEG